MMSRTALFYSVADARRRARRRLPEVLFDFIDGGSDDEITLEGNRRAYTEVDFRSRVATDIPKPDLTTVVLGSELSMPLALGPVGALRLVHPDGDRAAARAAGGFGTAFGVSTANHTPIEDVIAATTGPAWFQLYVHGGRDGSEGLVERAQKAGYRALIVTVDGGAGRIHERLHRHEAYGFPPRVDLRTALHFGPQLALRPSWTLGYLRDGLPTDFTGIAASPPQGRRGLYDAPYQPGGDWSDITWIRDVWKGPLVIKGLVTGDDARRAMDHGADAVVVSNHGGRNMDGLPATLRALPEVRQAVGADFPVLIDGGIRRGSDVVKALALGATAGLLGRAFVYGLAVRGEAGVTRILEIMRADIERTLRYLGCTSVHDLRPDVLDLTRFTAWGAR